MKRLRFQILFLTIIKIVIDAGVTYFTYFFSYLLRHQSIIDYRKDEYIRLFIFVLFVKMISFIFVGVYKHRRSFFSLDEIKYVFNGIALAFIVTVFYIFLSKSFIYSRAVIFLWFSLNFIFISIIHFMISRFESILTKIGFAIKNVAILGYTDTAKEIRRKIERFPAQGMRFVGYIDLRKRKRQKNVIGNFDEIYPLIVKYQINEIIIADDDLNDKKRMEIIRKIKKIGVDILIASSLFELMSSEITITEVYGIPTLTIAVSPIKGINYILKRFFDIVFSFMVIVIGFPFFSILALLIKIDSRGRVFFKQIRVTKNNSIFNCLKFRSMVQDAEKLKENIEHLNEKTDGPIFKMKEDPRITRMGKFLRKFSIDELPQFINVLKGEMSVVGPRPPIPAEVELYKPWQLERLSVKQGITGLWQVSGRSELSFEEMVKLDIFYIEHWSLWLDIKIILKTIPAIFTSKGAY